ncbi:TELO2-interacting protein 2 [Anolis carolinensis]|uniref:TELO2-interacting protein 2 n=1 Tax=Anolis carolinensis TaxID=28377 RepID=UPI002F2B6E00
MCPQTKPSGIGSRICACAGRQGGTSGMQRKGPLRSVPEREAVEAREVEASGEEPWASSLRLFANGGEGEAADLLRDLAAALGRSAAPLEPRADATATDRETDAGLAFSSLVSKLGEAQGLEGPVFVLAAAHSAHPGTARQAQALLDNLLRVRGCQSVPEFLRGACEGDEGCLAEVMRFLEPELRRETWQHNPSAKYIFCSVLQQVTRPWLSQHLEKVLPPALLLSDDYRVENKILGVKCLHHIIRNVPAADLCQFNRVQVVNHALSLHLYSKEAHLMQILLPCVLDLLPILEKSSLQQSHNPPLVTPSDEVFQLVLTHMEAEPQLSLRRIYARNLPTFVKRFGIQITQHLKRLQQVIVGYLEIADGPEEVARLAILDTLKCTIQHTWPRMTCHLSVLLKALLKMMWDVSTDNSFTPEPVKAELLQRATECLLLLDHSTHGQVKILLQGVYHHCQNDHLKNYLKKVQMEPVEVWPPGKLNKDV